LNVCVNEGIRCTVARRITGVSREQSAPLGADGGASGTHWDEVAFAQLYQCTSALVYTSAVRVLRDHAQAAEVMQDVYLQVWEGQARFHPELGAAVPWLLTIAHRRAVDRVRSSEARSRSELRYAGARPAAPFDPVIDHVLSTIEAQCLHEALNRLTEMQRITIALAYLGGYSHSQIAALLDVPLGTVKSRLRDGMRKLRLAFAERPS
jgi:RNA polymerase sigma-70 factor, ECF subfamily